MSELIEIPIEHRAPNHFVRLTPEIQAAILAPAMERIAALEKAQGATMQAAPKTDAQDEEAPVPESEYADKLAPGQYIMCLGPHGRYEVWDWRGDHWVDADNQTRRLIRGPGFCDGFLCRIDKVQNMAAENVRLKADLAAADKRHNDAVCAVHNTAATEIANLQTAFAAQADEIAGLKANITAARAELANEKTFRKEDRQTIDIIKRDLAAAKANADVVGAKARMLDDAAKMLDTLGVAKASDTGGMFTVQHRIGILQDEANKETGAAYRAAEAAEAGRDRALADLAAANARAEKLETFIRDLYANEFEDDTQSPIEDLVRHAFATLAQRSMDLRKANGRAEQLAGLLRNWLTACDTEPEFAVLRSATRTALAEEAKP